MNRSLPQKRAISPAAMTSAIRYASPFSAPMAPTLVGVASRRQQQPSVTVRFLDGTSLCPKNGFGRRADVNEPSAQMHLPTLSGAQSRRSDIERRADGG